jgi:hypothetical protein
MVSKFCVPKWEERNKAHTSKVLATLALRKWVRADTLANCVGPISSGDQRSSEPVAD